MKGKTLNIPAGPYGRNDLGARLCREAVRIIANNVGSLSPLTDDAENLQQAQVSSSFRTGAPIRGTGITATENWKRYGCRDLAASQWANATLFADQPTSSVFVATHDEDSLTVMESEFGDRVRSFNSLSHSACEAIRAGPTGRLLHSYIPQNPAATARSGREGVMEVLMLRRCSCLVHNGSGLARTVLLGNRYLPYVNTHVAQRTYVCGQPARRGERLFG